MNANTPILFKVRGGFHKICSNQKTCFQEVTIFFCILFYEQLGHQLGYLKTRTKFANVLQTMYYAIHLRKQLCYSSAAII